MERVNWQRVRDIIFSIVGVGILLWATWSIMGLFVHAILILLLAMAMAYLLSPVVDFLGKYIPRVLATLIVYALVLAAMGALFYGLVFSLIVQVQYFSNNLPQYILNLPNTYASFQKFLLQQGIPQDSIDEAINQVRDQASAFANSLLTNIVNIIFLVTDTIINVMLVVVISFYLIVDGKRIRDALVGLAPKRSMNHVLLFEDALNRVVGNYIRGQLTLAAIIGVLAGVGCATPWLGLSKFALIIAVLAFLFETIPMVGPALASIPAILLSLLLPDPLPRTFYIVAYFIVIQIIESNILGPRIVGHAVGIHPIASILALLVGVQLFGAFGALLATPIVAAAWVVIASIYRSLRGETADEILAKRRSPWIRLRTTRPLKDRVPVTFGGSLHRHIEGANHTHDHGTTTATVKGFSTSGVAANPLGSKHRVEHIDVMRHTPDSAASEQHLEIGEEEK